MHRILLFAAALVTYTEARAGRLAACAGDSDPVYSTGVITIDAPQDSSGGSTYVPITGWTATSTSLNCSNTPLAAFGAVVSGYQFHPGTVTVLLDGQTFIGNPLTADHGVVAIYRSTFAAVGRREKKRDASAEKKVVPFGVTNNSGEFRNRAFFGIVHVRLLARQDLPAGRHALGESARPFRFFIGSDTTPVSPDPDLSTLATRLWVRGTLVKNLATCRASVPAHIQLDTAKQADFSVDGSRIVSEKSVDISLDCPASTRGITVKATLADANDVGNRGRALKNTGTAARAHFRLKDPAGADILFGLDSSAPGTPHQFAVATVPAAGQAGVPVRLTVGYGNTGGLPGAGTVRGAATITFSYQ